MASEASWAARAGFSMQAIVWLALVLAAVCAILGADRVRHMWLMLAVAAIGSGALWLRLASWMAVKLVLPFDTIYAVAAWLSWILPLGAIGLLFRHHVAPPSVRLREKDRPVQQAPFRQPHI
jgi:uncharacterized membrane protein